MLLPFLSQELLSAQVLNRKKNDLKKWKKTSKKFGHLFLCKGKEEEKNNLQTLRTNDLRTFMTPEEFK